jgi:hypothetical protein
LKNVLQLVFDYVLICTLKFVAGWNLASLFTFKGYPKNKLSKKALTKAKALIDSSPNRLLNS